jgi:long-chain acyl-CoA synthetase
MFFTSGTTGNPKGVVHTHNTLIDRAAVGARFDKLTERTRCWPTCRRPGSARTSSYAQWLVAGYVVNCPESGATVTIDLKEVGPTYYFAPAAGVRRPADHVMIRMEDAGALKRKMFHAFMDVARRIGPDKMDGKPVGLHGLAEVRLGNFWSTARCATAWA